MSTGAAGQAGSGKLAIGTRVVIAGRKGTVRFLGEAKFAAGIWVGVDLDDAVGKNDGSVHGTSYFKCQQDHGIFVREKVCTPLGGQTSTPSQGGLTNPPPAGSKETAAADSDGSDDAVEEQPPPPPARISVRSRRLGVSAEGQGSMKGESSWTPPFHAKSAEERRQLSEIIRTSHDSKLQMMFGSVSDDTFEKIVDAMFLQTVKRGGNVIQQGDVGDFFYIVKTGRFDILVSKGDAPPKKVFEAGAGFAFGELALLYNAMRSATVTATTDAEVWCLDRPAFRNLVVASAEQQFRAYVDFLKKCDIFQELTSEEIASLAEVLNQEEFEEDEAILEQGEKDDKMYILQKGEAVACIQGEQGEVEVMHYKQGDYFGEIALLLGEPRKASVYAVGGPCTALYIIRETFLRILGPLGDFLKRNMEKYSKYSDAIRAASDITPAFGETNSFPVGSEDAGEQLEVFEGGVASLYQQPKMVTRKRRRAVTDMTGVDMHKAADVTVSDKAEAEPTTLKEKIAQDFKDSELVTPSGAFAVHGGDMQMFGGLILGQKFTEDKLVVASTKAKPQTDGLEDTYVWNAPTKLKANTEIAVVCQKGQKSASDPTPNQDNYFVLHQGGVEIYGVCDGHGPFGHLVSFRLVQSLPHLITKSPHFGKDWKLVLKEAFLQAQKELLAFCKGKNINVEASGAAGSVAIFEEQTVHISWIGDSTVLVASWNRRDSRLVFNTTDHKPQLPEERARLEASGSEVREVDEGSWRIYRPGSTFPGLTMSRAFGDTACGGVSQEPEYQQILMQPSDEYYIIVASDGVWEFIEPDKVVELTAKKLRLKGVRETLRFLVEASRKRWAYCCGDYCDDITAILVQWNAPAGNKEAPNHSLVVTRPG